MSDAKVSPEDALTDAQWRGAACVHCGIILRPAAVIDLGVRLGWRRGHETAWFPRACLPHGVRPWPPSPSSRR